MLFLYDSFKSSYKYYCVTLTSSHLLHLAQGLNIVVVYQKTKNRPHTPSLLLEMRTHVAVLLFCYCEAAGTLSGMTSVASEPKDTSCLTVAMALSSPCRTPFLYCPS